MTASFVQVPPQSTGKKVGTVARSEIFYDNLTGTITVGAVLTGQTSSATGTVTAIITEGFAANEGQIFLETVTGTFVDDENLQISAVTVAVANIPSGQNDVEYQKITLADPDNPENIQKIDRFGATVNTFTDGSPVFGPFGTMSVGEPHNIKEYRFEYNAANTEFYDSTSGTAVINWESDTGSIVLDTNGTASGARSTRTSHFYHPYVPGTGQLLEMTVSIGDSGKSNVRRRWGYFDNNNGLFWELDGTTLSVVIRSNTTGSVVDTKVNQSAFNTDKLDGSDSIGFNIDITKGNIYFIDFQWLGAGRVRFGIIEPAGSRIIAHQFENANINTEFPYMRTATLPFRVEQENTGTAPSSSEMRWVCSTIKHTSKTQIYGDPWSISAPTTAIANTDGETPLLAIRPRLTFGPANLPNHGLIKFISMSLENTPFVTYTNINAPVMYRLYVAPTIAVSGGTWANVDSGSMVECNSTATSLSGGRQVFAMTINQGQSEYIQGERNREIHSYELFLDADDASQKAYVLTAECLYANTRIGTSVIWEEIVQ